MAERKPRERDAGLAEWWQRPQPPASEIDATAPAEPRVPAPVGPPSGRGIVSIFSETKKVGRWIVPQHLRVVAVFGNAKVDLRQAVLEHHETVIDARAVFAEIQIIVPPGVIVECDGEAIMGAFSVQESKRWSRKIPPPPANAPIVRVIGSAYLAAVNIKVRPIQ
jgi:cell wall-active antibiotic response 4TMS protein YvqF